MNEMNTHQRIAVIAIILLAILLRFTGIGSQELWLDEAYSFHVAHSTNWQQYLKDDHTPPLYYLTLRAWMTVAGDSEVSLRSLSALFGVAFVALIMYIGKVIFCHRVSMWAGLIAAVSPLHIYYSQETRAYSLLVFAISLYFLLLLRACKCNNMRDWILAAFGIAIAFHVHYFALLVLPPIYTIVWLTKYQSTDKLGFRICACTIFTLLLCLPWLLWRFVIVDTGYEVDIAWHETVWIHTPPWLAIPRSLEVMALGSQQGLPIIYLKQFSTLQFPQPLRTLGLASLIIIMIFAAIPWRDSCLSEKMPSQLRLALWALLLFPLATLWLVSWIQPVYTVGRYDIVAFPGFCLLLGIGFAKLHSKVHLLRIIKYGLASTLLIPILTKLFLYYQAFPTQNARISAQNLHVSTHQDDIVAFTGTRGIVVTYYLHRLGYLWEEKNTCMHVEKKHRFVCTFYPHTTLDNFLYNPKPILNDEKVVRIEAERMVNAMTSEEGQLWLVLSWGVLDQGIMHITPQDQRLVQELTRLGFVYEPTDDPLTFLFKRVDMIPTRNNLKFPKSEI